MNRPPETNTDAFKKGVSDAAATMVTKPAYKRRVDYNAHSDERDAHSPENHPQPCRYCVTPIGDR